MASYEDIVKMMNEGKIKKKNKRRTKFGDNPHTGKKTEKTADQLRMIKQQRAADDKRRLRRDEELRERRKADVERERERQASRKAQQEERERLAMRDGFDNPEDDEYDPYTDEEYLETLYGGKDKLKLRF